MEDGIIVGNQDTPNNGGLLLTEAQFGNVEIALETRNDFGMDSGIFARCTQDGRAYQCLIDYYENGAIGGILGERIWNGRGVRNYSFGATPEIITLNETRSAVRCCRRRGRISGAPTTGTRCAWGATAMLRIRNPDRRAGTRLPAPPG